MAVFTVIEHDELTGSAASWTESSISASYAHLMLKVSARVDSGYYGYIDVQLNGDTTAANYSYTRLYAYQTGASKPVSDRGTANAYIMQTTGSSSTADTFGTGTMWIPNYANTTGFKQATVRASFTDIATSSAVRDSLTACMFHSTAAVNQITVTPLYANMVQHSTFTLIGVTGA